ncbi:hypothetical protein AGMMS50284_1420 [Clostridia bacterium]|nr:hypothetical protein AGMMS50284_1420 [Clostridia bacterium]
MKNNFSPNLPNEKISKVIISGEYPSIIKEFEKLGIKTITTKSHKALPLYESYHADLQCLHTHDNNVIVLQNNDYIVKQLEENNINYTICKSKGEDIYPYYILLNAAIIGDFILCKEIAIDPLVKEFAKENDKKIINVNQGYARCSTAIVSENAIITSDNSIIAAAKELEIDVLKIKKGFIDLPGYNYGFIGGCCGKLDKDTLLFIGKIEEHPEYKKMKSFADNHNVNLLSLTNEPLLDIGGFISI